MKKKLKTSTPPRKKGSDRVIFLDRDGVINRFPGRESYVTGWDQFRFLPNATRAVRYLTEKGFEVFVISNQGCVSRGLVTPEGLQAMTDQMLQCVARDGGRIAGVYYCIHQTSDDCECKKPKVALFEQAIRGRRVDLESTYFVGDSEEDVQAGRTLGCRTVLVLSGRTRREDVKGFQTRPDAVKTDLWEAVRWITRKK